MVGKRNHRSAKRYQNEDPSAYGLYSENESSIWQITGVSGDWRKNIYGRESDYSYIDNGLYNYNNYYDIYNMGFQSEDDYDGNHRYVPYNMRDIGFTDLESESEYSFMDRDQDGTSRLMDLGYKSQQPRCGQKQNRGNKKERKGLADKRNHYRQSDDVNIYVANTFDGQQGFRYRTREDKQKSLEHFENMSASESEEDVKISLKDKKIKSKYFKLTKPVNNDKSIVMYNTMLQKNSKDLTPSNNVNKIPLLLFQNNQTNESRKKTDNDLLYLPVIFKNDNGKLSMPRHIQTMTANNVVEKVAEKPLETIEVHPVSSIEEYVQSKEATEVHHVSSIEEYVQSKEANEVHHVSSIEEYVQSKETNEVHPVSSIEDVQSKENINSKLPTTVYNVTSSFSHLTTKSTTVLEDKKETESQTSIMSDRVDIKIYENDKAQRTHPNDKINKNGNFTNDGELLQSTNKNKPIEGKTVHNVYIMKNDQMDPFSGLKNMKDEKKDNMLEKNRQFKNNFKNSDYIYNAFESMPGVRYTVTQSSYSKEKNNGLGQSSSKVELKNLETLGPTPQPSNTVLLYANSKVNGEKSASEEPIAAPEVTILLLNKTQPSQLRDDVNKQEPSGQSKTKSNKKIKSKINKLNEDELSVQKDGIKSMPIIPQQNVDIYYSTKEKSHAEVFNPSIKKSKSKKSEKGNKEVPHIPPILGFDLTTLIIYCFCMAQFLLGVSIHDKFIEVLGAL